MMQSTVHGMPVLYCPLRCCSRSEDPVSDPSRKTFFPRTFLVVWFMKRPELCSLVSLSCPHVNKVWLKACCVSTCTASRSPGRKDFESWNTRRQCLSWSKGVFLFDHDFRLEVLANIEWLDTPCLWSLHYLCYLIVGNSHQKMIFM